MYLNWLRIISPGLSAIYYADSGNSMLSTQTRLPEKLSTNRVTIAFLFF